jgi:hypothetical protein
VSAARSGRDVHGEAVEELCGLVRAAFDGPAGWHDRVWAAGLAAMRYLREDTLRAHLLVAGSNRGDEDSIELRSRILSGLADLLDGGRHGDGQRGSRSRGTAEITAAAVYGMLLAKIESGALERGEDFLAGLVYVAVMPYIGSDTAEAELAIQPLR